MRHFIVFIIVDEWENQIFTFRNKNIHNVKASIDEELMEMMSHAERK